MASQKYIISVDEDFSLDCLSEGICGILEEEGLDTHVEVLPDNSYILRATNITGRGSHIARGITGTQRTITVYLNVSLGKLTMYFDERAWADKAFGFAFCWAVPALFFTSAYGGARQLFLEDRIVNYVYSVTNKEKEVNLLTMNVRHRILLATPIISLIIFLTMGFVFDMWGWGCLAFLLIPIMPICLGELSLDLIYPLVIAVAYVALGFALNLWHPAWILFLTIPVYYILFPKKTRNVFKKSYNY